MSEAKRSFNSTKFAALGTALLAATFARNAIALQTANQNGNEENSAYVQLESLKTHSRMSFKLDEGVSAQFKNTKKGFEIFFKGIGLTDLGASLGEEAKWKDTFQKLADPRVTNLRFTEVSGGLKVEGEWKFPTGADAPANPIMEAFDYREKAPVAAYVIDFWLKAGPSVGQVKEHKKQVELAAAMKKAEEEAHIRAARKAAVEKIRADVEDITRFCRLPLSGETDIFLPFYPIHEKFDFSKWFPTTTPDSNFPYYSPKDKEPDAQYVRLALELYRQSKIALTLKTLDFFDVEHPNSFFRHEMNFLRANALIKLGMHQEAERVLGRLMADAKDTPEALFSGMYLAQKLAQNGTALASLESFMWLISHYPDNRLSWVFHMGAAEAMYSLKQTDRAALEYQWVEENAPNSKAKAEAAMRQGDLYMNRFQYEQALAAYYQGLKRFAKEAKDFPATYINRAEALYGIGQYDRAQEAYKEFLDRYPAHPGGWRATFRVGEILARKAETLAESKTWFIDTINHYPTSPGATLARMRIVSCGDHAGMDVATIDRFLGNEVETFDGGGEVMMPLYKDFKALTKMRALIMTERTESAVDVAIEELKSNHHGESRALIGTLLGRLFRKNILTLLENGKRYEAIAFYHEKSAFIPKDGTVDRDYLLKLSQAAADLELGLLAQDFLGTYEKSGEFKALEERPDPSKLAKMLSATEREALDLEAELKLSEQHFTIAKAEWTANRAKNESKIREHLEFVKAESPFSFEKEIILGLLNEKTQDFESALEHASKAQLLKPSLSSAKASAASDLRLRSWVASLAERGGDLAGAYNLSRAVEADIAKQSSFAPESPKGDVLSPSAILGALGLPVPPTQEQVVMKEAQLLEKLDRWSEAAATYLRATQKGWGGNQAVYGYAHALLQSGTDHPKAVAALEKLAGDSSARNPAAAGTGAGAAKVEDFWKKMAAEALTNEATLRDR